MIGSVVIPAYNEQNVIGSCLATLAPAVADGRLEIVVVANGCSDRTVEVAREFAGVQVIELAQGGKPGALNAGDAAVTAYPRIYLDADVVLPLDSALVLLARLSAPDGPLAGRPPLRYDGASAALVRRYYRARSQLPAVLGSLWGAGVYAVSAAGRARFGEFPDMVADDLWVDQRFEPSEIEIVDCEPVVVSVPRNIGSLLAVLRRTYRGKAEYHAASEGNARETVGDTRRDVVALARRNLVDATAYTGIVLTARISSRLIPKPRWERDDTSRGEVRD